MEQMPTPKVVHVDAQMPRRKVAVESVRWRLKQPWTLLGLQKAKLPTSLEIYLQHKCHITQWLVFIMITHKQSTMC
jgi:hypothetical protein